MAALVLSIAGAAAGNTLLGPTGAIAGRLVGAPLAAAVAHKNKIASGSVAAGGASTATWWDWVAAHPYEAATIVAGGVLIVAGAGYAIAHIHKAKQEAPTPGLVPVKAAEGDRTMNRRKTKPSRKPHRQRPSADPGHINEREQLTPAQKRANALFWLIAVSVSVRRSISCRP